MIKYLLTFYLPVVILIATQKKMQEYIENGTRLGWLIVRSSGRVEIYRQGQEVEVWESPVSLSGEDVLPGFILNLESIW